MQRCLQDSSFEACPICGSKIAKALMASHVNSCMDGKTAVGKPSSPSRQVAGSIRAALVSTSGSQSLALSHCWKYFGALQEVQYGHSSFRRGSGHDSYPEI